MSNKMFATPAPFGVGTKRFCKIGFHPELDPTGFMKRDISKLGPGSYNPEYAKCKSKKGSCWKTKLETEEFSKVLGYRNATILYEREFYKTLRGPGTNDLNEALFKPKKCSTFENVNLGTGERFKDRKDNIPPPDHYFRDLSKISSVKPKGFSKTPTLEWDGFVDRFKSSEPNFRLSPNKYTLPNKGIDATLRKFVSKRGPYDLFTGPRDPTTIKNHFSPPNFTPPDYFHIEPSSLDYLLKHPTKERCGKFLCGKRFPKKPTLRSMLTDITLCYKSPRDPGPAHYDLSMTDSIKLKKSSLYPFDLSKANARPPLNWTIFPGPGRYNPKAPKCMRLKKASWPFLSTVQRGIFKPIDYTAY